MLEDFAPVILLVLGLLMLFIEMALIPGFGLAGIVGFGLVIWGSMLAISSWGLLAGGLLVTAAVLLACLILWWFFKSRASSRLVRKEVIQGHSSWVPSLEHLLGQEGQAISDLRPSGIISIDGVQYDVLTQGSYVTKGSRVMVKGIETNSIIVVPLDD